MGCCHSTANANADSTTSPYLPVHHPATTASASSSRAAIVPPLPLPSSSDSPRNSSPTLAQAPSRSHRTLAPSEHFNAPLRPHIPLSKPRSKSKPSKQRTWTRSLLEKERGEFFETRVTGRAEVWGGLKLATELLREGGVQDAQGVLDASGVTVPTGDLVDGCYDEQGALYQLPAWVVAEPERVVEDGGLEGGEEGTEVGDDNEEGDLAGEKEKGKEVVSVGEGMKVKARLSDRGGPDVVVVVGREERVGALVRRIQREANLPGKGRIKIAYMGKLLKEGESLQVQGWREGHVINALVFPQ